MEKLDDKTGTERTQGIESKLKPLELVGEEIERELRTNRPYLTVGGYVNEVLARKPPGIQITGRGKFTKAVLGELLTRSINDESILLYLDEDLEDTARVLFHDNIYEEPDGGIRVKAKPSKSIGYHRNK